ncbi:hypothetical protein [Bifidobacterium cuniculi]|uniref:Uncharacterized protein n=1 Tax=Bifidobacterium cuniculi TaxID=1688 RepID=A0A087B2L7_9BIFI|nr:hypothetical protein [Bifidobacterium cuniculi]KFI65267.1 hypothetical protein BCUN_1033 [Bifidobacterium cuniculi]
MRRFYRRHRTLVTALAVGLIALVAVGRVPLMPDADSMFTPFSGASTLLASPLAGGALMLRQRSRRAMRWYVFAMLLGTTGPMLIGYFNNIVGTDMAVRPSFLGDVTATLSSFAPTLLFVGGALLGYWFARRRRHRRW